MFIERLLLIYILNLLFFFSQLPCRAGQQSTNSRLNEEKNRKYLVQISRHRFSLVISGLTRTLERVNQLLRSGHCADQEKNCYESIIIVLDTLEQCLAIQPKDYKENKDETMIVKLLLREICQFISK